jgi:hypothetical protein
MRQSLLWAAALAAAVTVAASTAAGAQDYPYQCRIAAHQGDQLLLECTTSVGDAATVPGDPAMAAHHLAAATASEPLPAAPLPDDADSLWHPPGAHGDRPAHEHGDAPPAWLTDAGFHVGFSHAHGTPNENVPYWKHTGFKGWAGRFGDVEWYGLFHLDVNPGGHGGRFHSYQLWLRDASGAISHFSGWMDFGQDAQTGANKVVSCDTESFVRPVILVNAAGECQAIRFENWYAAAAGSGPWAPDIGFNIAPSYRDGGDPADPSTWMPIDGHVHHLTRRIEFAWYAHRSPLRGAFWADQWGRPVAGPDDPWCADVRTIGDRTYDVLCAEQYIAPTLPSITFPGNAEQRTFAGDGVVTLPN